MAVFKTVLVHYNVPPIAGGVERVVAEHAKLFGMYGDVVVLYGNGDERGFAEQPNLAAVRMEELDLRNPRLLAAMEDVEDAEFLAFKNRIKERLRDFCSEASFVVGHNVFTMPFHLPLTLALVELAQELEEVRFVSWVHDVGILHPHLTIPHDGPWRVLREAQPRVQYIAVSELRRAQVLDALGAAQCDVVPNGIDVIEFLGSSMEVAELAGSWEFFEAEFVILCPVRILRRKNIELAIRTTAVLAAKGKDVRLVITGAPDLYNPDSLSYEKELRTLVQELHIEEIVCFVHEFFRPNNEDIRCLYQISDALIFPSRHEGFGLPLLEAAVTRTPIFCADIEPLSSLFETPTHRFNPRSEPTAVAELMLSVLGSSLCASRFRECVRRYECFTLFKKTVEPLLGLRDFEPGNRTKP